MTAYCRVSCLPWLAGALFCQVALGCGDNYRFLNEKLRESDALLYIKNFRRQSMDDQARLQWDLQAKEAFLFQKEVQETGKRVIAYDFSFRIYDIKQTSRFHLQAGRGELDYNKGRLFLERQVVYEDHKGTRLSSEKMEYDLKRKMLSSNAAVHLKQAGVDTVCQKGIRIDIASGRQICRAPWIRASTIPNAKTNALEFWLR